MIYFTSDLHLGHRNVIPYCERPFPDVATMHEYIVRYWNSLVRPEDTVYLTGDISLNPKWVRDIFPLLNGTKHLIMGNHDACFPTNKKSDKMREKYLAQFASVELHKEITLSNGMQVLLSHTPYNSPDGLEYDDRYISYRPVDTGLFLLHGHLHGRYKKNGNMIDVGLDANNMMFYSEADIIKLIEDERSFIPSSLTEYYKTLSKRENMVG